MLHCNMKLVWQSSYACIDSDVFDLGGLVDFDRGNNGGEGLSARTKSRDAGTEKCAASAARSAQCSMNTNRSGFSQSIWTA
jgi:hypothetical protein